MSTINSIALVKQIRIKQRTEPWMTSDITYEIGQINTAFKECPSCLSDEH